MVIRLSRKITIFLLLGILAACSQGINTPDHAAGSPVAAASPTQAVTAAATYTPQATKAPTASMTPEINPSETPAMNRTEDPAMNLLDTSFQMCSPLGWETIPELWEIVTNPFNFLGPGREDGHHGVDFAHYRRKGHLDMVGEEIDSVLPGRTAASIQDRLPYGNMVIIETVYTDLPADLAAALNMSDSQSLYLLYAHMQNPPSVGLGDPVSCGQHLGEVGTTGMDIVNEHLHLEARLGPPSVSFASMAFYDTRASTEEMADYRRWRTSGEFAAFDPMSLFAAYLRRTGQPVPTVMPTTAPDG